jgi:hypothetical protein
VSVAAHRHLGRLFRQLQGLSSPSAGVLDRPNHAWRRSEPLGVLAGCGRAAGWRRGRPPGFYSCRRCRRLPPAATADSHVEALPAHPWPARCPACPTLTCRRGRGGRRRGLGAAWRPRYHRRRRRGSERAQRPVHRPAAGPQLQHLHRLKLCHQEAGPAAGRHNRRARRCAGRTGRMLPAAACGVLLRLSVARDTASRSAGEHHPPPCAGLPSAGLQAAAASPTCASRCGGWAC